jgi:CHAD domain-containing protein
MNTPSTSPTCNVATNYCRFGSQTLLKLLAGFENLIDGVIENVDIEYVHKTRVTSRRLRAAMPIFEKCFPEKKFKAWSRETKKVTKLLSEARDLDVQIAFIEQYIKKLESTSEKDVLNSLLREHKTKRKNIQFAVIEGIEKLKTSGIINEIREHCKSIESEKSIKNFESLLLEKAHWHISFRLDDFLSMEKYVHLEKEKLRHHEMRVYAKKLRYTMEIFSLLYATSLEEQIATMKTFQDVLGEIHDYDVWIEYIPTIKGKIKKTKNRNQTTIDQALRNFSNFVKERRRKNFCQFVSLYENKNKENFFENLRKTTNTELATATQKSLNQTLANPKVKIAVISDVHANLQALETGASLIGRQENPGVPGTAR